MEKNHICKKCGGIAGWDSYYQSWICTRCGDVERKPITNGDRIRSMTDEELAEFISGKARTFGEEYEGYMSALDWLKEEVSNG
jgi:hypothetical protein